MKMKIILTCLLFCSSAMAVDISGIEQGTLQLLRATANEDPNTDIGSIAISNATAGDWDSKPTEANGLVVFEDSPLGNQKQTTKKYIAVMACARAAADKTFTVNYWVWFADAGPAIKVCSVAYVTGTQKVVKYPHNGTAVADSYWADTGTITGTPMGLYQSTDALNNVKIIIFDTMGAYAIYAEVLNADGTTGAEAGDVTVYWYNLSG